jgi:hypothetical protein
LIGIDDLHAVEAFRSFVDKDVQRVANEMVEAFQCDLDEIVL